MADLGAIGRLSGNIWYVRTTPQDIPTARELPIGAGRAAVLAEDIGGTLSGQVKIADVAAANVKVCLQIRSDAIPIRWALSDSSGNWSFTGLDRTRIGEYMVTVLDPKDGSPFNYTIVRDHLTPG